MMTTIQEIINKRRFFPVLKILLFLSLFFFILSCEPLATSFDDTEDAEYYTDSKSGTVPDTFTAVKVMTWNIRFGAGRIPWFGDACGDRVVLTEEEVYASLDGIVEQINKIKPDILLLQEVDMNSKRSAYINQLKYIMEHTYLSYAVSGAQWKAQFIPSDGLGRLEENNSILSRWKISDAKRIQLQLRGDQDQLTRYFYERCCVVEARIEIPRINNFYVLNIHASAFATDDTKHQHILSFNNELDRLNAEGSLFVAGGDLNTLPPGSDTTDYCMDDMCPGESFHHPGDNPMHKDGSNYTPESTWLTALYTYYHSAIPLDKYHQDPSLYFTHTTRGGHFWDRTLDHLFSNLNWVNNSGFVNQQALTESDHAAVCASLLLPE